MITSFGEQKDASEAERAVREIGTGIFCCRVLELFDALAEIRPDNVQEKYYLGMSCRSYKINLSLVGDRMPRSLALSILLSGSPVY